VDAVNDFSPNEFGSKLRDSFDPEALAKRLEALKQKASDGVASPIGEQVNKAINDVKAIEFKGFEDVIKNGQKLSKKTTSAGTFVGAAAGRIAAGSLTARMFEIQKQQFEFEKKKELAKIKRDAEQLKATKAGSLNLPTV